MDARGLFLAALAVAGLGLAGCQNQQAAGDRDSEAARAEAAEEVAPEDVTKEEVRDDSNRITAVRLSTDAIRVRPDWVSNPGIGGVLGSVGVAARNDLGTRFQVDEARLAARLEIANMLETRVQSAGRDVTDQSIAAQRRGGELTQNNDSRYDKLGIDRRIADIVLSGSRQRGLWVDPETGDVFVWMVMDGRVLDAVDHTIDNGISVFVASQRITTEYIPPRPEIVVEMEDAPRPAPPKPKTPVEELEGYLNELESQPIHRDDTEEIDGGSSATREVDPDLAGEVTGQRGGGGA
jgi:hypothetical protein